MELCNEPPEQRRRINISRCIICDELLKNGQTVFILLNQMDLKHYLIELNYEETLFTKGFLG